MAEKARSPTVSSDPDSGSYKVQLPANPEGESRVDVNPGSTTHPVLADTTGSPDPVIDERRKHPAPVQVSVQQERSNGGLVGWPATIANMSAVGFVLLLTFLMYRDFVSTVKERDQLIREEMRSNRDASDRNVALVDRSIQAMTVAINSMQSKFDALASSNTALAAEFRASRISLEALIAKLLKPPEQP